MLAVATHEDRMTILAVPLQFQQEAIASTGGRYTDSSR
jgi:hypothetical protein